MDAQSFRYDGKRALVVGGATGMGAATADLLVDLGAEVVNMDHVTVDRPGMRFIQVDLRDEESINEALDACGGPIDALFSCAGAADGTPGIEKINFIGHRHLIDRALEHDLLPRGASIGMISSAAGLGWERDLELITEYLDTPDFDSAAAWIEANGHADYMFSKQTMCAYVCRQAFPMQQRGLRINAILPGPTDTPLAQANKEMWLGFGADYREAAKVEASTSEQQAGPLAFLCSDAAQYVNGVILITDAGYVASGLTSSFPEAKPAVDFLYGRY